MELKITLEESEAFIAVGGDIDEEGANQLKARLMELLPKNPKEVTFDFAGVSFIGSTGIGKLLLFYKALSSKGGRIKIINMSQDLLTLFNVIKLDKVFEVSG